jgi:hypothetical protein
MILSLPLCCLFFMSATSSCKFHRKLMMHEYLFAGLAMTFASNMFLNWMGKPSIHLPACMIVWGVLSCLTGWFFFTSDFLRLTLTLWQVLQRSRSPTFSLLRSDLIRFFSLKLCGSSSDTLLLGFRGGSILPWRVISPFQGKVLYQSRGDSFIQYHTSGINATK